MDTINGNIVLFGFMGAGKTTVGKLLAKELSALFVDMDEYIEAREGSAIPELFERFSEQGFRDIEHEAILELADKKGIVIATGGGALLFGRNVEALRKNGLTVLLDLDFDVCYDRISSSDRPIVRSNTREELRSIYNRRRPQYLAAADYVLDNPCDSEKAVEDIMANVCL